MADLKPWEVVSRHTVFEGSRYVKLEVDRVRLPDGREVDDFYRVTVPDYVSIIALTAEQKLIMLRQYKHGIGRVSVTAPAGRIEHGEKPISAARRELLEETGYASDRWIEAGTFVMAANLRFTMMNVFFAQEARKVKSPDSGDLEEMEILLLDASEVRGLITGGQVVDAGSALSLSLYLLDRVSRSSL